MVLAASTFLNSSITFNSVNYEDGAFIAPDESFLIFESDRPEGIAGSIDLYGSSWKQLDADGPKNCIPHGMLYDEKEKAVILITILFNSGSQNSPRKNEMWKWTGSLWKKLSYPAPSTSAASIQALSSFGKNGIVLYDGDAVSGNMGTTWKFTQNKWTRHTIPGPGMRVGHAMIYDKKRKTTVLFGGSNRSEYFHDTWEWDGNEWKEIK